MAPGEFVQPGNADFPWDKFDPVDYLDHNYTTMRDDDRQVLTFVRDFFVRISPALIDRPMRGIDVGTGPNLYPALAMLPFCAEVTLYEFSKSNVDWLATQHAANWPSWTTIWSDFWRVLCEESLYAGLDRADMGSELSSRTKVTWGNVFELDSERDGYYDIGTMFFGPESLSPQRSEFHSAIDRLLSVLRPEAPFAIGLMEHSAGYDVADNRFPATDIELSDVTDYLEGRASGLSSERVDPGDVPIRDGYTGMMVVCGLVAR
ncbi:SCO2525 family SAM-dependent methyltransferase [Kibdelosporangium aridum]|uniref:SCO2525 family SAM-dependent methyltransferase n=1 Tax=Kibdelosporangium aridum TaxID=2030 RepID=UPI000564E75E|nr:SCO2525 family SAM-dependent methyltransferase [Kibdelosporangium aridum]